MRVPLSHFELQALAREIRSRLEGAKVANVYSMPDGSYTLKLRTRSGTVELRVVPESLLFLVEGTYEEHPPPDEFASSLRSRLRGRTVMDFRAVEGERVVEVLFDSGDKLLLQLFPGGRTVLLSESGEVVISRPALERGERVQAPTPRPLNSQELLGALRSLPGDQKVGSAMVRSLNLPPKYVNEVLHRAEIEGSRRVRELSAEELERIGGALSGILEELSAGRPLVYRSREGVEVSMARLTHLEAKGYEPVAFGTINEAVSRYFAEHSAVQRAASRSKEVEERAARLSREIAEKEEALRKVEVDAVELRALADEVFARMHELESFRVGSDASAEIGVLSVKREGGALVVRMGGAEFPLSAREQVSKQASRIYERVKGLEEAARNIRAEVERLRSEVEELRRSVTAAMFVEEPSVKRSRPREWYEAYRWTFTSSGRLVVAGRDAQSNVRLLRRHTDPDDLVFHAEVRGSPVALLKGGGNEKDILETATFCGCHSRAWREGLGSVTVYYVKPEQISFTPPPGTYLPKGSFIVKPPKNYLQVRLELAVGITPDGRAVSGSRGWVSSVATVYAVVAPGRRRAVEVARELLRAASESGLELDGSLVAELASLVPYGSAEVVEVARAAVRGEASGSQP
ncbi:MAG: NFACT family protein [Thaumarchaeota archaeon]|nr:NFACT family protein [Candidatus Calditenuaceae archaeon]MDW8041268.1 NFACT family protein [Nitrososphaerota archaeon]MDW8042842.1 NFACT family protein [Nitrososphaerota archaeon]